MKQRFSKRTRLVSALLTLAMVCTFLPFSAFADDEVDYWVPLHSENFPDKTFLEYIRTTFDKGGSEDGEPNGILEPGEHRSVREIDVRNKNITSLWGITCFQNLEKLYCSDNQLTSLNLSYNTKLKPENFECSGNKYPITIDETERTFDLSTLPAEFDVNKTSEWAGGTVEGNTLKVKPGATQVTYTYDCGNGLTSVFSLQVLTLTRIKQVNLRVNTPKNGKMPDETVVILDNGADVCEAKIYWVEGDGVGGKPIPGTFRPGKRYTLQVGLYAKPGYKFSEETVCTVNGRETEFSWTQNDDTEYCAIKHYSVSLNPGGFEHDHTMEMTHDEYSHWMECPICHTVQDTEGHVYDDDKDTTCNVCGYVRSLTPGGSTPGGSTGGSTGGGTTIPPEAGKYQLTVTDGVATVNGSTGAVLNVKPGDTVTLTADTTKFPENEEFGWWEITPYGSVSNTLTGQYQRTATFAMPNENVSARAMSKSAGVSTGGDDGGGGGGAAILLVGGAAVAGLVGYGVYSYVSEQQLKALLPEGVAMPENRAQTALLLWNTAGRPEPAEAPAFKDVADPDTAKAAQWCVEHGLMDQKLGGRFAPDNSDPAYKTLNAYQQLVG